MLWPNMVVFILGTLSCAYSIQPGVQAGVASLIPAGNTAAVGQNPFH